MRKEANLFRPNKSLQKFVNSFVKTALTMKAEKFVMIKIKYL